MVIRRRLFALMCIMAASSLLVLFLFWMLLQRNANTFIESSNKDHHDAISRIIQLEGEVVNGLVYDYTFRTEMADSVKSGDEMRAKQNLDTALESFRCDACWIFGKDNSLVDCLERDGAGLERTSLTPGQCAKAFASDKFPHWFAKVGASIVEFNGGVVQPSEDIERITPAQGYFVVARVWDAEHLAKMQKLFSSDEVIISDEELSCCEHPQDDACSSSHVYALPVLGGTKPIYLRAMVSRSSIAELVEISGFASVVISIMMILTVALFILGLTVWVSVPISLMSRAMEEEKPGLVEPLVGQKNEIGRLAHLIKSFFVQKSELKNEVAHRKQIQDKQEKVNRILRIWGRCNFAMATCSSGDEMLQKVCSIVVEEGGYKAVWVGSVKWDGFKASVTPSSKSGDDEGYLELIKPMLMEDASGSTCVVGESLRSKGVAVCRSIDASRPGCEEWKKEAANRGIESAACFPMIQQGEVFAVLVILSSEPAGLDQEERKIFVEVIENLGAGMQLRRSEESRRNAEQKAEDLSEELMQTRKLEAVGRLAGGIAHDFNNLLFVIMGNLEMCIEDNKAVSCRTELVKAMDACRQAADLTRQLLSLGKKRATVSEAVQINKEIEKALELIRGTLQENVDVKLMLDSEVGPILGDPVQVRQLIMHIALNAAQAMPDGGRFTISTESVVEAGYSPDAVPGDYVLLTVADTGEGMDDEVVGHIYEPFFTTKDEGAGLGLSLVNSIVSQHGGFLRVSSTKGGGTIFRVFLPIADVVPGGESEIACKEVLRARDGENVLLVEDREMCRYLTKTMLESLGYTVTAAASPEDAINQVKQGKVHFDVILSDVVMQGMNGPKMVEQISECGIDSKVVYMSGYADGVLAEHGIAGTRVGMLQKPFLLAQLAQIIREAIVKG